MGILNINMLQGNIDNTEYLTSYTDIYLKEALANLGQRTGIKGEGISQGSFTANELINNYSDSAYLAKYFIHAAYDIENDTVEVTLYNTETHSDEGNSHIYDTTGNYITVDELICDEYHSPFSKSRKAGGKIQHNEDKYRFVFGELANIGDSDSIGAMMDEISEDGKLLKGLRFRNIEDLTYVYYIVNSEECEYDLYLHTIDLKDTSIDDLVEGLEKYKDIDEALVDLDLSDITIIGQHFNAKYDTENSQFYILLGANEDLNNFINEFAYDITSWFKVFKSVYNNEMYFTEYNNVNLKTTILIELIKSIYENSDLNNINTILVDNKYNVYIPALYRIYYYVNDSNDLQIYSSLSDLYIRYQEVDIDKDITFKYDYPVIIAEGSITKITSFKFTIIYDGDYVVSINWDKVLTLPYIANGYWYIDDQNTGVYAIGKDAGQPNIIISVTDYLPEDEKELDFKILHAAEKDAIGTTSQRETITYKVPHQVVDQNTTTTVELTACLPAIDDLMSNHGRLRLLEDALIINMIDVRQNDALVKALGSGYVTTFWGIELNEDSTEYVYSPVMLNTGEGGYALDMDAIINLESYIKYSLYNEYEPDRYEHQWLVFKMVSTTLKQQVAEAMKLYPNIHNKEILNNTSDPLETFGEADSTSTKYYNPTNMVIEYSTNVEKDAYGITDIKPNAEGERYFKIEELSYPTYRIEKVTYEGESYYERVFDGFAYTYVFSDVINYHDYPNEVIPNSTLEDIDDGSYQAYKNIYPTVDLKEVLLRNTNTLNRTNVIGIDPISYGDSTKGGIYYGYFGVSVDGDRNHLKIGTSNTDSNLGASTLVDKADTHKFNKFEELDVDIKYTNFNSYARFNEDAFMNKTLWKVTSIQDNDTSYCSYSAIVRAIGKVDDLFNVTATPITNTRYMNELGISENNHIAYDTTLNIDKLLASIALSYDDATIYCDGSICSDMKMHLTTSNIAIDENRLYNDVYVSNPIEITYTDAIKDIYTYTDFNPFTKYSYIAYTGYTEGSHDFIEYWTCDGCEVCSNAVVCSMYYLCKHTTVELEPVLAQVTGYGRSIDDINVNNSFDYIYSYEYSIKSGIFSGNLEEYSQAVIDTPELFTSTYLPVITGSETAYDEPSVSYFDILYRTINIREVATTNSTPEYQNKL